MPQLTGVLAPTPRRVPRHDVEPVEERGRTRRSPLCTSSMPEPPGPPGFVSSTPIRVPPAGWRARPSVMCAPPGRDQSSGTDSVAHSMSPQWCHTSEPVRSVAARRTRGRGGARRQRPRQRRTTIRGATPCERDRPGTLRRRHARGRGRRVDRARSLARVPPELACRPGVPRGDALRSRQLARRRRRGTAAARGAARAAELRRYVEGWGRIGDVAIVALDRLDEPVGAAWYRRFTADEPGLRLRRPDVPELSIAVYPECRGRHVGGLLLGSLVDRARADG